MKITISTAQRSSPAIPEPSYKTFEDSYRCLADMALKTINALLEEAGEQRENKHTVPKRVCVKKVRLVLTDPEATDTSSDEEDEFATQRRVVTKRPFTKRVVTELALPPRTCYVNATPSESNIFEVDRIPRSAPSSCIIHQRTSKKRSFSEMEEYQDLQVFGKTDDSAGFCNGCMAVRRLSSGKWPVEHRDEVCRKIGMYDSERAADMVQYSAARQIQDSQTTADVRSTTEALKAVVKICGVSCSNECVNFKEYSGPLTDEAESSLCSSFADNVSGDNDGWSRNDRMGADSSEMLSLYMDLDSMECMLNPDTEGNLQSRFQTGSPSSVLEHVMPEGSASAGKGCVDTVCGEYGVASASAVLASVTAQSSILMQEPDTMDALFLDDITGFGHDIVDILSLQSTFKARDILAPSQGTCPYNGFLDDGDLAAMNFELDSEALAWIGIPAV